MGKKDQDNGLDKDSRKRLEKADAQWNKSCSIWGEELTLADLRLLLEHFGPLQELIRSIASTPAGEASGTAARETTVRHERFAETDPADSDGAEALARTRTELEQALGQCDSLTRDLTHCTAITQQLMQNNEELKRIRTQLEIRLQQLQEELGACQAAQARSARAPVELGLLRSDVELAQQMGLAELPADDVAALAQTVAVLAQRDSLERLWSVFKERCEAQGRCVSEAEQALLSSALGWYNHNWRSRPYRFIDAAPGVAYDYQQHLRSRHTSSGETVSALHLPGIADGSGKPLCKALVSTH